MPRYICLIIVLISFLIIACNDDHATGGYPKPSDKVSLKVGQQWTYEEHSVFLFDDTSSVNKDSTNDFKHTFTLEILKDTLINGTKCFVVKSAHSLYTDVYYVNTDTGLIYVNDYSDGWPMLRKHNGQDRLSELIRDAELTKYNYSMSADNSSLLLKYPMVLDLEWELKGALGYMKRKIVSNQMITTLMGVFNCYEINNGRVQSSSYNPVNYKYYTNIGLIKETYYHRGKVNPDPMIPFHYIEYRDTTLLISYSND